MTREPAAAEEVIEGAPEIGATDLPVAGPVEVGIWEITPGTVVDTEVDEVFVVLSGAARVEFDDGSDPMELGPGSVARLVAGSRTRWTVTETLRKVYLLLPPSE